MTEARRRSLTLLVCCLSQFMVVLDVSIVNVALPSIAADLGFTPTSLAWVVNAYTLAFAGFLLLGIGLFRARVVPRWVPILLWAFLAVEFAGSALSEWASSVSGVLYLVALTAIAVAIWRSPISSWESRSVASEVAPEPRTASLS